MLTFTVRLAAIGLLVLAAFGCEENARIPQELDAALTDSLGDGEVTPAEDRSQESSDGLPEVRREARPADETAAVLPVASLQNRACELYLGPSADRSVGSAALDLLGEPARFGLWKLEKRAADTYLLINLVTGRTAQPIGKRSEAVALELPRPGDTGQHWQIQMLEDGFVRIQAADGRVLTAVERDGGWQVELARWRNRPGQQWRLAEPNR